MVFALNILFVLDETRTWRKLDMENQKVPYSKRVKMELKDLQYLLNFPGVPEKVRLQLIEELKTFGEKVQYLISEERSQ